MKKNALANQNLLAKFLHIFEKKVASKEETKI